MIISHTGSNNWEYSEIKRVWSSVSFSPTIKIRTIVVVPAATDVEVRPEFDFIEGANEFYPYQIEFITSQKDLGYAKMYNLEGKKILNISTSGIKDIWDIKAQGLFLRIGLKSSLPCQIDFQTLLQADI